MCMYLGYFWRIQRYFARKRKHTAYKVLVTNNGNLIPLIHWEELYNRPGWGSLDKLSDIVTSNRDSAILSFFDKYDRTINRGIHCFVKLNDAKEYKNNNFGKDSKFKIIEVEIKPEDVVAIGRYGNHPYFKNIVATKVYPKKILFD